MFGKSDVGAACLGSDNNATQRRSSYTFVFICFSPTYGHKLAKRVKGEIQQELKGRASVE